MTFVERLIVDQATKHAQRRASDPRASAWVSANAGAGKTKVHTDRVVRLLLSGSPPGRILCLTFTKAAAANMAIRVFERLGRWVTLDEESLSRELIDLEGAPPDLDTLRFARRLFARADTPAAVAALGVETIASIIAESTFAPAKAAQIHAIAVRTAAEFGGELPADAETLTSFKGVGPKCANLALGVATGAAGIAVDVHVHRVTNRWGYVAAATPEKTLAALERVLPRRWWVEINRLLVPFGKHVCTGVRPRCSTCPLMDMCARVGVTSHR